jgi:hypothetical protein
LQASLSTLSRELGINPKAVAKWRKRATVEDSKTWPTASHSTTLTEAEEAAVVAFQRHTLLQLDDCLYALQPSIPHLTRSGGGHVAFAVGEDATHFHVLGGNQGARVSIMRIEKARWRHAVRQSDGRGLSCRSSRCLRLPASQSLETRREAVVMSRQG